LLVVRISLKWVISPEQGKSSGRLLPVASGQVCFGMAFPPFLMKQLHYCDSVAITVFVGMVYHEKVRMTVG